MKKLILFTLMFLFLFSYVSAVRVDYSPNDKGIKDMKAVVKDTILFDLIAVGEQGTMELKSHKTPTEIIEVGTGWQVTMIYDTNFGQAHKDILGKVYFYDLKTGEEVEREYKFVYWGTEERERDTYETICEVNSTSKNETESCYSQVNGTETYTYEGWLDYNSKDLPKGQIKLGLMTNVLYKDKIDGVWEVQGKKIEKHAGWTSGLSVGLVSYYKLDETSGTTAYDSLGRNNGTIVNGVVYNNSGKIGGAYSFNESFGQYINTGILLTNNQTINGWVKLDTITGNTWQMFNTGGPNDNGLRVGNSGTHPYISLYNWVGFNDTLQTIIDMDTTLTAGVWYMYTISYGSQGLYFYLNGDLVGNTSYTTAWTSLFDDFYIGTIQTLQARSPDGLIDEVGIWNRSLSSTEVSELYNNGNGITYEKGLIINLLSPMDYYNSSSSTIDFSANLTDEWDFGIQNVSLVINDTIYDTNTSGLTGVYNFSETLSDGFYEWYIEAYDLNSKSYKSNTRYFNHQINPPKIEMIYPYGLIDFVYIIGGNQILPLNFKVIDSLLSHVWYNYNGTNVSINDLLNGEEIFNRNRSILNPSQISLTSGTLTKIDEIEIDGYVINMSAELWSSSTSYNKELVQYIIYKNGTSISQSNITSSTTPILMNFINPHILEPVDRVEFWGREVSTSGTGYVRNRQVNFHLQEYINLTTKKNITIYANDTLGNLAEETFNWTYETVIYNITTYNETEYCYDNSINYEDIPDGIYGAEAITCTNESLCNSTEVRTIYIDTTYPLIEYAPNSDLTNITGNFTDKDWIFVNVTYTEINEANVTFTLMDQTGDLEVIVFDDFTEIWEQENYSISYNFTNLEDSMYFYAVRICDLANNCNTTDVQYYGVETTNLTLDFNYTDLDLELGSPIMINATNNLGQVCVDIDHPDYGTNYSCGTYKTGFELVIDYFSKKFFSNGEEYQEFTFSGEENKSYNLTSHKYDTLDNLSFNILGNATLLRFYNYASGIIERGFFGSLIGDRIYLNETIEVNETTFVSFLTPENNLTFTTSGVSSVYLLMDDNAKDINLSFDVYGEEFGLEYENYLNSTAKVSDTDFDLTTARVGGGFIVPGGTNPMNFTYDNFTDGIINETLWYVSPNQSIASTVLYDSINTESTGKLTLYSDYTRIWGKDSVINANNYLATMYTNYYNIMSPLQTFIELDYNTRSRNYKINSECKAYHNIQIGGITLWEHDKNICSRKDSSNEFRDCIDSTRSINTLKFYLTPLLNGSYEFKIEGVEEIYGEYRNDYQGWDCGDKKITYNWTEGMAYVTHDYTVDSECQDYNFTLENPQYFSDLNSSEGLYIHQKMYGGFWTTYNDGCYDMTSTLNLYNLNTTLLDVSNSSYYTNSLLDAQGKISQATTFVNSNSFNESDAIYAYLSSDKGDNYEIVINNINHIFEDSGTNLKARYDFNLVEGGYRTDLPFINYFNVSTPKGYPTNLSFMLGDTIYATINGELNETNSPQTIIIENPNTTNMFRGQTFQSTDEPFNHLYDVPLRVFSDSTGFVTVNNYNLTYDPNPIILNVSDMQDYLYDSEDDWNIFELIVKGQNGDLNITDLEFDYAGGNYTIPIIAHNDLYTRTVTRFVNYFFTMWDYVFGSPTINYLEFIPLSPTSKNVSAYGQTNTVPIINLTHLGYYEGKNASISLKLDSEQEDSCVNLTISKTNNKSEGFLLNTTWQEFETNVSYLDNTPIWMWVDYQCNYSNWRLWQPNFYVRYCCDGCVCSEEV